MWWEGKDHDSCLSSKFSGFTGLVAGVAVKYGILFGYVCVLDTMFHEF
jgi:hypothetical protein